MQNPLPIRLEDNFEDILQKAAKGLKYGRLALMENSGLSMLDIQPLLEGKCDPTNLYTLAKTLNLNPEALIALATENYYPVVDSVRSFQAYNAPFPVPGYEEMTVNSFSITLPKTNNLILFDPAGNFEKITETLSQTNGTLLAIFITHGHRDHITDLEKYRSHFPNIPVYAHPEELKGSTHPITFGETIKIDSLVIKPIKTHGHSPAGTSYFITGLDQPICIVGDAIFAGSVGGIPTNYSKRIKELKNFLISLPNETLLAPGHGPCSTASLELNSNPFFAEEES